MPLIRHQPAAPLAQFVDCIWWSRRDAPQDHWEHILPAGSVQLVFALHQHSLLWLPPGASVPVRWSGALVHGPQSRHYLTGPKPAGAAAGVAFRPGAAGALLGVPAAQLADRHIGLDQLWGAAARQLQQRLLEAAEPAAVFRLVEQALLARLQRPLLMHPAVAQALTHRAPWSPAWTAQARLASGYSPRHFIALFHEAVGLVPKQFQRIRRFNRVLQALDGAPGGSLADVAADGGYADQAHLAREFRELAGLPPSRYRPRPGSPHHHQAAAPPG